MTAGGICPKHNSSCQQWHAPSPSLRLVRSWSSQRGAMEALPVQALTTLQAKWYPSDFARGKLDVPCWECSDSSLVMVMASMQKQQEGFWGDSPATSTACSAVGGTSKQKGNKTQPSSFGSSSTENIKEVQAITGDFNSHLKAMSLQCSMPQRNSLAKPTLLGGKRFTWTPL